MGLILMSPQRGISMSVINSQIAQEADEYVSSAKSRLMMIISLSLGASLGGCQSDSSPYDELLMMTLAQDQGSRPQQLNDLGDGVINGGINDRGEEMGGEEMGGEEMGDTAGDLPDETLAGQDQSGGNDSDYDEYLGPLIYPDQQIQSPITINTLTALNQIISNNDERTIYLFPIFNSKTIC